MIKIYNELDRDIWNKTVKSFLNWDIYYLYEYALSFKIHGDGDIFLVYFEYQNDRLCYVVMQKDIANSSLFRGKLYNGFYYDWETPYGYGGPLVDRPLSKEAQNVFKVELNEYCTRNNIVSQFIRFHPLLKNFEVLQNFIETKYLRDTIFIDTSVDKNEIMSNMASKNRNMVRKAIKNDVSIVRVDINELQNFIPMYIETMQKNKADEYYIFNSEYFDSLRKMSDNVCVFYAMYNDIPISGAIIYYNYKFAHYHLSGSHVNYRKYAPSNLLLYEVACWAHARGIKLFHLGGGMSPDDSLFGFKKQFNKHGRAPFVVGRTIFNKEAYDFLLDVREKNEESFDRNNGFMIQYRR